MMLERRALEPKALAVGALTGLAVIVPISVVVEVLERNVENLEGSVWLLLPFVAVLVAYVAAGRVAARHALHAPLVHAALAALGAFGGWLVVRVAVPLARGDTLGFGTRAVAINAMFAVAFGILGAAMSRRDAGV
jgi:hypothetical protein